MLKRILFLIMLLLPILACSLAAPQNEVNNQVRQAVYQYERGTRGYAQVLVVRFERSEPRIRFSGQYEENNGRTFWVENFGEWEYFRTRPPTETYLYIGEINYSSPITAVVYVYRGGGEAEQVNQEWELTLTKPITDTWQVTQEVKIE